MERGYPQVMQQVLDEPAQKPGPGSFSYSRAPACEGSEARTDPREAVLSTGSRLQGGAAPPAAGGTLLSTRHRDSERPRRAGPGVCTARKSEVARRSHSDLLSNFPSHPIPKVAPKPLPPASNAVGPTPIKGSLRQVLGRTQNGKGRSHLEGSSPGSCKAEDARAPGPSSPFQA